MSLLDLFRDPERPLQPSAELVPTLDIGVDEYDPTRDEGDYDGQAEAATP